MIVVSLLLIVVAVALLLVGLWEPSSVLLSASIGTSLLAAVVLVIGARRPAHREFALEWQPRHGGGPRDDQEPSPETLRRLDLVATGGREPRVPGAARRWDETVADAATPPPTAGEAGPEQPASDVAAGTTSVGSGAPPAAEELTPPVDSSIPQQSGPYDGPAHDPANTAAEPDDFELADEPAAQQVSEADAARVGRMGTEVLVVDGRPRYHLPGCVHLLGRDSEPLPVSEAVELGFSPCGLCEPDSALLADARRV